MDYKEILVNGIGSTTVINLNRPEKLNALNESVLKRMEDAVSVIEKDGKCKAVIITGSGEKAFSAGVDISYLRGMRNEKDASEFIGRVHALFGRIENMEKPVIGAINGFCIGGGLELALVCDIRIAASSATFGLPEGKLGIIPGGGATFRLPRTVGLAKAKEMIFTGESIGAEEALRIGLVNRVVSQDLMNEAISLASKISENSFNSVRMAKKAMNSTISSDYTAEKNSFISAFANADKDEGLEAFLEHRKPRFA